MIKVKAVGDICPGDKNIMGLGVLSKSKEFGYDFPLREAVGFLQGADIVLGNFEGLLSTKAREKNGSGLTFCGLPEFAQAMARSGFSVLNVANNHSLEHGPGIFLESVECLKSAGISICGLRSQSNEFYSEPVILSIKGQRIGILGYNWVGVDNFKEADSLIAQSHSSLVNYTWDREGFKGVPLEKANETVINDVKKLRDSVDILLLMTHWGYEYINNPPYSLTIEARSFIDAGADIIIGGHPHVLQGLEKYQSGLIVYSLGNFIFDFRQKFARYTTVLDISVSEKHEYACKFIPLYINGQFQPREATVEESLCIDSIVRSSNQALTSLEKQLLLNDDALYMTHEQFYKTVKIRNIGNYFLASLRHPSLLIVIIKKVIVFLSILWARLNGQRVRW